MQILTRETEKREGIADGDAHVCNHCKSRPAEIFQVTGDYCLECWQTITHTNA
jgi:hypothetical protein